MYVRASHLFLSNIRSNPIQRVCLHDTTTHTYMMSLFKASAAVLIVTLVFTSWHVYEYGAELSKETFNIYAEKIISLSLNHCHDVLSYMLSSIAWITSSSSEVIHTHSTSSEKLFTKKELKQHIGEYLAIVGEVFDVRKGERYYGKDGGYHFFTGLDGTRAFASGDFTEKGLIEDVTGLSGSMIISIEEFREMYHKDYHYIGKLIGHYYDADGKPTPGLIAYNDLLKKANLVKLDEKADLKLYPPCNSEFNQKMRRVWCSDKSGGIERGWTGVPRKYYKPGSRSHRCACIRTTGPPGQPSDTHNNRGDLDNPSFKLYENCQPLAVSCMLEPRGSHRQKAKTKDQKS